MKNAVRTPQVYIALETLQQEAERLHTEAVRNSFAQELHDACPLTVSECQRTLGCVDGLERHR